MKNKIFAVVFALVFPNIALFAYESKCETFLSDVIAEASQRKDFALFNGAVSVASQDDINGRCLGTKYYDQSTGVGHRVALLRVVIDNWNDDHLYVALLQLIKAGVDLQKPDELGAPILAICDRPDSEALRNFRNLHKVMCKDNP